MLYEIKMINSLSQPTLSVLSFTLSNWTAKNISGNAVTLGNATLLSSSRSYAPLRPHLQGRRSGISHDSKPRLRP